MANGPRVKIEITEKRFPALAEPLFMQLAFDVTPGSLLALVGPSGIGKSSLLRMIAGIDTDFSGTITINAIPAADAPPAGFVFQDPRLLPWLSAIGNVMAVNPKTSRAEAETWLGRVGLGSAGDALPHELSGGMQRRVGLARALSVNARLLLLDEPFVSLDQRLVLDLQGLLGELVTAEEATAILVTHLPEDAARLADRVLTLGGRPARITGDVKIETLRAQRTPDEVLRLTEMLSNPTKEMVR